MTTTTTPRPTTTPAPVRPTRAETGDLTFTGTLAGEWIKLWSLRSTWWTVGLTIAVMALLSLAVAATAGEFVASAASVGLEAHGAELVVSGFQFVMVTVAVLGALFVTGEYGTGMVRSTFAAVPARVPVLVAKALVLTVVTAVVGVLCALAGTLAAAPWLADHGLVPALDQWHTWQAFGGMTYFFVVVALLSLGLGAVLRHTAATITAVLGLLLLVPGVLQFVAVDWVQDLVSLMPLPAAIAFIGTSGLQGTNEVLSAWQGVGVVAAYAVLALVAGAVCLRRRDV